VRLQELLDQYLRKTNIGSLKTAASEIDTLSVENLFIAGSSVFPTCGYANPTWSIVALTLRLAEHLQQESNRVRVS